MWQKSNILKFENLLRRKWTTLSFSYSRHHNYCRQQRWCHSPYPANDTGIVLHITIILLNQYPFCMKHIFRNSQKSTKNEKPVKTQFSPLRGFLWQETFAHFTCNVFWIASDNCLSERIWSAISAIQIQLKQGLPNALSYFSC